MGGVGQMIMIYVTSKEGLVYQCCMITRLSKLYNYRVGGVQEGQNIDYVMYGWSLSLQQRICFLI